MHIITAITGASGVVYGQKFVEEVNKNGYRQTLLISDPGWQVLNHELELSLPETDRSGDISQYLSSVWDLSDPELINYEDIHNLKAVIASGSRAPEAMVIIPCTMGSLARLAQGLGSNLLERSFDVLLKEKKKLIIVPRETALSPIHLQNMLTLSKMNVDIIPAMPAFYHQPSTITDLVNFIVGRVLEHLSIEHSLYQGWSGDNYEEE